MLSLDVLRDELRAVGAAASYVLFGSIVLYLHGLRDAVGDIDVFLPEPQWNDLRSRPCWRVERPRPDDPPYLSGATEPPLAAFYDWTKRDGWLSVDDCYRSAEFVRGFRCVSLEQVRKHKRHAENQGAEKHLRDLAVLDYVLA